MDRTILSLVIVTGLVGVLSAGTLVVGYRATNEALAAPSDPLIEIDETLLVLDTLHLGMPERDLREHGALRFEHGETSHGITRWEANTRDNPRYRSVRVLTRDGRAVGMRVVYRQPNVRAHDQWRELLAAPYRMTDVDRHWETAALKLKARRDATAFYAVRKRYRGQLDW